MVAATDRELRRAYQQAVHHYPEDRCPYESGEDMGERQSDLRTAYYDGWYDTKYKSKLAKFGIVYPIRTQSYWVGNR